MMRKRTMRRRSAAAAVFLLVGGLLGCSQSPSTSTAPGDVKVSEITTGRELAPDGTIAGPPTNLFWTTDTFYVSVTTEGTAPSATIKARWTGPDGKVVHETEKTITPNGTMVTGLEAKKAERWEPGDYKVEILVNDVSAGTKDLNAR